MDRESKVVVGSYRTPEEVRAELERLEREGYAREDITLYTDRTNLGQLGDTHDIDTQTDETHRTTGEASTDRSFWDEIKDMFSDDGTDDRMTDDVPGDDFLAPYRQDIQNGSTVIAVRNYRGDMGITDTDAPNVMENEKIQLKEERLHVEKDEVQTGEVNVRKETVHETETIDVPVEHEEVVIERKPVIDGKTDVTDTDFDEESETYTIPVTEEKVRVEKEPVVTEEVEIKKERKEDIERVTEDVRREEIDIDSTGKVNKTSGIDGDLNLDDRDLTDRDLTDRDLTDRDLTDRDLTDRDLTDRDLTDRDLTDRDLTDRDLTDPDRTDPF